MKVTYGMQLAGKILCQVAIWSILVILIGKRVGLM